MVGAAQAAALKKGRVVKSGGRPVTEMSLVLDALLNKAAVRRGDLRVS